jgi:amino acid transporter
MRLIRYVGPGAIGAASRTVFALARDNGLPFPSLLSRVEPTFQSPIIAIFVGTAMGSVLLLFATDPNQEQMLESLINSAVCGMQISYAMPILGKVFYNKVIPATPFSLGGWSRFIGIISCGWLVTVSILTFLPNEYPVTALSMNWAIVSTFGFYLICYLNWEFNSKYTFKGPKIYTSNPNPLAVAKPQVSTPTVSPMQDTVESTDFFV